MKKVEWSGVTLIAEGLLLMFSQSAYAADVSVSTDLLWAFGAVVVLGGAAMAIFVAERKAKTHETAAQIWKDQLDALLKKRGVSDQDIAALNIKLDADTSAFEDQLSGAAKAVAAFRDQVIEHFDAVASAANGVKVPVAAIHTPASDLPQRAAAEIDALVEKASTISPLGVKAKEALTGALIDSTTLPSDPTLPLNFKPQPSLGEVYIDRDDFMKAIGATGFRQPVVLDGKPVHNGSGSAVEYWTWPDSGGVRNSPQVKVTTT